MQTKWLVAGTTAILTVISFLLTRVILRDDPGRHAGADAGSGSTPLTPTVIEPRFMTTEGS